MFNFQCIPHGEEPIAIEPPLSIQHLILKTAMHENEFFGIRFFLNSCPLLETLTIESSPTRNILEVSDFIILNVNLYKLFNSK